MCVCVIAQRERERESKERFPLSLSGSGALVCLLLPPLVRSSGCCRSSTSERERESEGERVCESTSREQETERGSSSCSSRRASVSLCPSSCFLLPDPRVPISSRLVPLPSLPLVPSSRVHAWLHSARAATSPASVVAIRCAGRSLAAAADGAGQQEPAPGGDLEQAF